MGHEKTIWNKSNKVELYFNNIFYYIIKVITPSNTLQITTSLKGLLFIYEKEFWVNKILFKNKVFTLTTILYLSLKDKEIFTYEKNNYININCIYLH